MQRNLCLALTILLFAPVPGRTQELPDAPGERAPAGAAPAVTSVFPIGENLEYSVHFGPFRVGRGVMRIAGLEAVRGQPAAHAQFEITGKALWYSVHDMLESWFDPEHFVSYRFHKDIKQSTDSRQEHYEIFPDQGTFSQDERPPEPTSPDPLDDVSFLYFVRALPLAVGDRLELNRYFKPKHNPVKVVVIGRETIEVTAGTFACFVLHPELPERGIFKKGSDAKIWISDDDRRLVVRVSTKLPFGSLHLKLTKVSGAPGGVLQAGGGQSQRP
ncbi:MAG: DUF3108 domain-containing protein [Candidatus Schekmanbacteria bacterium]|nr:DUF3108 domain-containing protein [Candidatus Schekmanbacteria bacterium]